jgi:uncharacterized membrane protein
MNIPDYPPDPAGEGQAEQGPEPVWSYRGYQLRGSDFNTAMVHMYRAEVQRANVWRQRLDSTTNWAVLATGAAISYAFTLAQTSHIVIPLNIILVTIFLYIEARRYRYYELWSYRVRLMETDFFAAMLVPPWHPAPDWAEALAEHLLHPHFPVSMVEAVGRRLRRNYLWIYIVIGLAWVAKIYLHPDNAVFLHELFDRASVGPIPGPWVVLFIGGLYLLLFFFSIATIGLQNSPGEVLPRYGSLPDSLSGVSRIFPSKGLRAWFRPSYHRQQFLTLVITDKTEAVTQRIMKEIRRGVTSLEGVGMYTGKKHSVLMVALTVTEIPNLKSVVSREDPSAFVIVSPAQEILGRGFQPLGNDEPSPKSS